MKTIRQKEVERKIERIALYQGRRVTEIDQIVEESLEPVLPNKLGMFFDAVISFDTFEPEENFYNLLTDTIQPKRLHLNLCSDKNKGQVIIVPPLYIERR